jgi:hypothetical protein
MKSASITGVDYWMSVILGVKVETKIKDELWCIKVSMIDLPGMNEGENWVAPDAKDTD